ncbi:MAG: polysaccharide deacetylase family protein [bacterium]
MYDILALILILVFVGMSLRWNWWRKKRQGVTILMYHNIDLAPRDSKMKKLWISPMMFEKQMKFLSKGEYNVITLRELYNAFSEKRNLGDKTVVITFDDGFLNNYTHAFSILKKYNFKATVFLSVAYVGDKSAWNSNSVESPHDMLGWENIREMFDYGIDFGSHTLTHANLIYCKDEPRRLSFELNESKRIIEEKLNMPVMAFAYPYGAGAYDENIKKSVKVAGYHLACGIKQGKAQLSQKNMFNLRRVLVRGDENMFDFRLNIERGKARL